MLGMVELSSMSSSRRCDRIVALIVRRMDGAPWCDRAETAQIVLNRSGMGRSEPRKSALARMGKWFEWVVKK